VEGIKKWEAKDAYRPPWEDPWYPRRTTPWSNRWSWGKARRTFSGKVVYSRPHHAFTRKDIERISKKVLENTPENTDNWIENLINKYWKFWMDLYKPLMEELGAWPFFEYWMTKSLELFKRIALEGAFNLVVESVAIITGINELLPFEDRLSFVSAEEMTALKDELATAQQHILYLESMLGR